MVSQQERLTAMYRSFSACLKWLFFTLVERPWQHGQGSVSKLWALVSFCVMESIGLGNTVNSLKEGAARQTAVEIGRQAGRQGVYSESNPFCLIVNARVLKKCVLT